MRGIHQGLLCFADFDADILYVKHWSYQYQVFLTSAIFDMNLVKLGGCVLFAFQTPCALVIPYGSTELGYIWFM